MTLEHDARFAAMLEECCRRVQGGEHLERCLADYPAGDRAALARLVPLASDLGRLGRDPSPAFQARLEQRLLAAVDEERRVRRRGPLGQLGRFFTAAPMLRLAAVALAVLVVLVGSGVGIIQASDGSLPDSPLYQVKTAREWVELALARNGETQVGVYARQIEDGGGEMDRAVRGGKPQRVVEVLAARLVQSIDRMVDQAIEMRARGNPRPAVRATVALRAMQRRLDQVIAQASPDLRPALQRLRLFLERQEQRLTQPNFAALTNRGRFD